MSRVTTASSLFQARTWWNSRIVNDQFDSKSVAVAKLLSVQNNQVIIGGFSGILRIYLPQQDNSKDVLLEQQLPAPILQLEIGNFHSSKGPHLAVLHPLKLSVYAIAVAADQSIQLNPLYECAFRHTAASFVSGQFAKSDKTRFCVQSLDGLLFFFEQTQLMFTRQIPGFLLPGQMVYCAKSDSIVLSTAAFNLESYKFSSLASATEERGKEGEDTSSQLAKGKRAKADWTLSVGENVLDMQVVVTSEGTRILLLGEFTMYFLSEDGSVVLSKRFENAVSSFYPYRIHGSDIYLLLGHHNNSISVLKGSKVIWGARVDYLPIALRTGTFGGVSGLIAGLGIDGSVSVSFMGTNPSMPTNKPDAARDINYDELDDELRQLQGVIRSTVLGEIPTEISDLVKISLSEPVAIRQRPGRDDDETRAQLTTSIELSVLYTGDDIIENINVVVETDSAIVVDQPFIPIPQMDSVQKVFAVTLKFGAAPQFIASSLNFSVNVSYLTSTGDSRSLLHEGKLPLSLLCAAVAPSKSAEYKLTLESNQDVVQLTSLFSELSWGGGSSGPNAVGFRFVSGPDVSILASKTNGRYRIQSDTFEALAIIVSELEARLKQSQGGDKVEISFTEPIPLQDYFQIIDNHYEFRVVLAKLRDMITVRTKQFRIIQTRLLMRFKDKTPAPLQHLDTLLEGTFQQIVALSENEQENARGLAICSNHLTCGTRLILILLRVQAKLNMDQAKLLESAWSPTVTDTLELGWEEQTDTSLTHFIRTQLTKAEMDVSVNPPSLELPSATIKLKKHIAIVCEKLTRGVSKSE